LKQRFELVELLAAQALSSTPYHEFIRSDAMSVGLYILPAGGVDRQQPHREDEVYVVLSGSAKFTAGGDTRDARSGDVIYVAREVPHSFHDVTDEMRLIVVFAPPESMP
jgi:mannose-6-phosphate isomerase-like protein (cupin superfamily)